MDNKKFFRYCPNCSHYNKSSGICNYVNENNRDYPSSLIKNCNGEYLSLIKGKKIIPESRFDDDYDVNSEMVTVYSENNSAVFQIPSNETDRKINTFIGRWALVIIIFIIVLMNTVFLIFKSD